MADSIRERILAAMVAALNAAGKPAGLTVNRSRRQSIETVQLPMMSVYFAGQENSLPGENRRAPLMDRQMNVHVISRVIGADIALDPLYKWTVKALMTDQTLGGLALAITETSSEADTDDTSDADRTVETIVFRVRYITNRVDAEKPN